MLPYDEAGAGEPVVLLHAGVADRRMWRQHLGWLAASGFRALAIDLPGFGEAAIGTGPQAPWEDVLETLRDLEVSQAAVVGNSFGAAVALRMAAIAPAAVSALVLISPPPLDHEPSPVLEGAWEAESVALQRGDLDSAVEAVLEAWTQPNAPQALRDQIAEMQRRAFELQTGASDVEEATDPLEQDPELLAGLQIRALAAAGEYDMPDFRNGAEELVAALPLGRSAIILGAGHLAPLEAPEAFQELLLDFFRGTAQPGGHSSHPGRTSPVS